ncbi:hypothetical protein P691DRAFT_831133 [Macrolepiota fuliginosa MF-IS2]|uniref:C2H2-type domain-containing protein n=1 Tax=Macrolepiota fuliginosa MF-IS2 TaxID=1400762 RepID=A0A9P5XKQ8_9AGAR|nr:hypothetical protein P691DRAFT_831133 [Macrolepiota fuliginosa MF-IS2]
MMFARSQIAGNMTLASLNATFYPPTNPTRSKLWSLGSTSQQGLDDDFQSNVPLQVSRESPSAFSTAPAGLGIMYPPTERTGHQDDTHGTLRIGYVSDAMYRHRTFMRTEAIYESQLAINDEPIVESAQGPILHMAPPEFPVHVPADEQGRWVLQQILEASGHTVESLSVGVAFIYFPSCVDHTTLPNTISTIQDPDLQSNAACSQNAFLRLRDSPVFGINPADIMPPLERVPPLPPLDTPDLGLADAEDSEAEANPCTIAPAAAPVIPEEPSQSLPLLNSHNLCQFEGVILPLKKESDYEPSLSFSAESSNESAFVPSFSKRKTRSRITKTTRRTTIKRRVASPYAITPQPSAESSATFEVSDLPINYGTPVLDAHRGITIGELKAKAERYRLRNQCQEYDKKWLLSFAGKLTPQGLLTEEYRCYIAGCAQSNRRRDHILIHVGGHLDQRPFACPDCSARFLRKNECKRHELSHTGTRPFTCDMCPPGATAFVRQDLLKRHQNRTHGMDATRGRAVKRHRRI